MTYRVVLLCVLLLGFASLPAMAQERGQYLPGTAGLNSGIQAPEGFTYANLLIWYPATKYKDQDGDTVPLDFDLNLLADLNLIAYTTKAKFLGANVGMSLVVPIVNTPVSLPRLGRGINPTGIGDLYVEPINLGWKLKKADVRLAYGFVAPTGKFGDSDETTTTDYWGHQITFAATKYLNATKLTQVSVSTNFEFHHTKRHEDVKVGNNMTVEGGLGKIFIKDKGKALLQVGAVGYAEFQLTNDSGSEVAVLNAGNKDRVFAVGPEIGLILPTKKFNFLMRVLPEFGARNRTQGITVAFGLVKSF